MCGGQLLEPVGYQISWSQSVRLSAYLAFQSVDLQTILLSYRVYMLHSCTYIHSMTGVVYSVYVHYTSTATTSKGR